MTKNPEVIHVTVKTKHAQKLLKQLAESDDIVIEGKQIENKKQGTGSKIMITPPRKQKPEGMSMVKEFRGMLNAEQAASLELHIKTMRAEWDMRPSAQL
jgi:coenzyme F420-reducing hydrogenase beta subunit